MEADAQRGNERAEGAEKKITDIEEELRYHCYNIVNQLITRCQILRYCIVGLFIIVKKLNLSNLELSYLFFIFIYKLNYSNLRYDV